MGDVLLRLNRAELDACRSALKLINDKAFELSYLKRGHQHLWNELAEKHGLVGKKIEIDYETGLVMETDEVAHG